MATPAPATSSVDPSEVARPTTGTGVGQTLLDRITSTSSTQQATARASGNPPIGWMTGSQRIGTTVSASNPSATAWPRPHVGDGTNSQLYLFIFLAAVILLGIVGFIMIGRAVVGRRRFQRRVREAIARGETVPQYQNPFYARAAAAKQAKALPPMPVLWETQMRRMDEKDQEALTDEWFTPVSLNRVYPYTSPEPTPQPQVPGSPPLREELREALSDMFPRLSRQRRREAQHVGPPRPETAIEMRLPTVSDAPEPGADLRVGVLIAMPCEGQQLAMWTPVDPIEAEVPEVYVGVMECTAKES